MFKEADHQGSIEIGLPDHVKLALEGSLPPAKQKTQLTPSASAQNLPVQHDIKPPALQPNAITATKAKVLFPLQCPHKAA